MIEDLIVSIGLGVIAVLVVVVLAINLPSPWNLIFLALVWIGVFITA